MPQESAFLMGSPALEPVLLADLPLITEHLLSASLVTKPQTLLSQIQDGRERRCLPPLLPKGLFIKYVSDSATGFWASRGWTAWHIHLLACPLSPVCIIGSEKCLLESTDRKGREKMRALVGKYGFMSLP